LYRYNGKVAKRVGKSVKGWFWAVKCEMGFYFRLWSVLSAQIQPKQKKLLIFVKGVLGNDGACRSLIQIERNE